MDVPQLKATRKSNFYMRFKSLAPYYSAFIVVLCIYLYSEHKLKVCFLRKKLIRKKSWHFNLSRIFKFWFFKFKILILAKWLELLLGDHFRISFFLRNVSLKMFQEIRNLPSFSNLTTKFSSGQTTSVPLSATPPTNDVSQPIWRNFILNGVPDSQIDMNDPGLSTLKDNLKIIFLINLNNIKRFRADQTSGGTRKSRWSEQNFTDSKRKSDLWGKMEWLVNRYSSSQQTRSTKRMFQIYRRS